MHIFPAIDLCGGQVVRLLHGDYSKKTVYSSSPCSVAEDFINAGAKYLHVVDLDGAKDGTPVNFDSIAALCAMGKLFVEVGGGIRTQERIEQYLELGVGRVILGTAAVKDFAFTKRMAAEYPGKIAVGVDVKNGFAATDGWLEVSKERGIDFCRRLFEAGIENIIYTDISRDGAGIGTNLDAYRELGKIKGLKVTASGGITFPEELAELDAMGVYGAILGKALYTGRLNLREVIEKVQAD